MATWTAEKYSGVFIPKIVKKVTESIPLFGIIQDKIKMSDADRIGEKFVIPTVLQLEQGVTYAKSNSGAFALNIAIDGLLKQLEVVGSQITLRSTISDEAIVSSQNEDQAIEQIMTRVSKNNAISHRKRLEIALLHGQMPKAIVESRTDGAIVFTAASFSPAMWAGMKGAVLEFFDNAYAAKIATGGTSGTLTNVATILSVDTMARSITVDAFANIVATNVVQFQGAVTPNATPSLVVWHEMAGMRKILSTVTGAPFGLDIPTYDVLMPNYFSGAGAWSSYGLLSRARSYCLDHGGEDPEYIALMSSLQYNHLLEEEDSRRMHDSSYSRARAEVGSNTVRFAAAGQGTIEPIAHPYMTPGEVLLFTWADWRRPGAQDFTFNLTGGKEEARWSPEGRYIIDLTDNAGHQIRSYSHGALIHELPSHAAMIHTLAVA